MIGLNVICSLAMSFTVPGREILPFLPIESPFTPATERRSVPACVAVICTETTVPFFFIALTRKPPYTRTFVNDTYFQRAGTAGKT